MDKFYMCYVEGTEGTHVKHPNIVWAASEAERLAKLPENVGKRVFILSSTAFCRSRHLPISWEVIRDGS